MAMSPAAKWLLIAGIVVTTAVTVLFARVMVSPGALIAGHDDIESDCFACHAAFRGATTDKCVSCHKLADIGRLTTVGTPVFILSTLHPFHEMLQERYCAGCHSDHEGLKIYRTYLAFSHDTITPRSRDDCAACHKDPDDPVHRPIPETCKDCHKVEAWKPATFDHGILAEADRRNCLSCHRKDKPNDPLHRNVPAYCGNCHTTTTWKRTCPGFCGFKLEKTTGQGESD